MDALDAIGDWFLRHEQTADKTLIWSLFLGYAALAIVKADTWNIMRRQRDRTHVGIALKRQYLAEIFKNAGQAMLYGLIIWAERVYPNVPFDVWDRMGIRSIVILSILFAVIFNVALNYALRGELARAIALDAAESRPDAPQRTEPA